MDCKDSNYDYCEGNAKRETGYTTLRMKVVVYPNTDNQVYLKTELTWDIMPSHRLEDFISLSWHHDQVLSAKDQVKASRIIDYYYEDYWYDTCGCSKRYFWCSFMHRETF